VRAIQSVHRQHRIDAIALRPLDNDGHHFERIGLLNDRGPHSFGSSEETGRLNALLDDAPQESV
jgi:hypothetical protein